MTGVYADFSTLAPGEDEADTVSLVSFLVMALLWLYQWVGWRSREEGTGGMYIV